MPPATMFMRAATPLLFINSLASVLAKQEQPHDGGALRGSAAAAASAAAPSSGTVPEVSRPRARDAEDLPRKGLGLQLGSFVWHEADVSKPQDPASDQAVWRGLGPQIGSRVWHERAGAAGSQDGGSEVSISLQPAFGEGLGLGLGPQMGSRTYTREEGEEQPAREVGAASGGAEVSMPLTEQDLVDMGRTVPLGPQMQTRVAPGGREFYTTWYAYTAEFLTQPNGRFFQLCLLVNVLVLMVAFYFGMPGAKKDKDKLRFFRCGPRRRHLSSASLSGY